LAYHRAQNQSCPAIFTALAAWLRHIRGQTDPVNDPLANAMQQAWLDVGAAGITSALFGSGGLIASDWQPTAQECTTLLEYLRL
jgi:fructuronate reductase